MKKLCALLLCMAMLSASICAVQAATDVNVAETFDDLTIGATNWSKTVFGNYTYEGNGAETVISDDGFAGKCLEITENDTTGFKIYSKLKESLASHNAFTFKIKILDDINKTARFSINAGSSDGLLYIQNGEFLTNTAKRFNYEIDTWYDVLIEFTSAQTNITVKDKEGNSISGSRSGSYNYWLLCDNVPVANASIAVDEFRLIQCEEISTEPTVQTPDGLLQTTENVSRLPEFTFSYEPFMKVDADDITVAVADENGAPVDSSFYTATISFEKVNIRFTQMLEKNTGYTITLSGVKGMADASVSPYSFTFTTELVHKLSLAEDGLNITSGDTPAIELTFDGTLGYPSTDVKVMSVIYDNGMMSYLDYRTGVVDATGKLILSSYTLPAGKQLSDLTILVFADSEQLIPVCEAIKCFE